MKAVYNRDGVIFGVGKTGRAAVADANLWLDAEQQIVSTRQLGGFYNRNDGEFTWFCSEISIPLAVQVLEKGGQVGWEMEDKIMIIAE